MARPTTIKDEEILRAAREVFLARGISATTAEVAERAKISEGTIFHRFKSKVELFRAAMDFGTDAFAVEWLGGLENRVGRGEVLEQLHELAHGALAFFRRMMPLMMMSWSNPGSSGLPDKLQVPNMPPLVALKQLTGYFEAEMRAGRLRRHDPEIVARMFVGSLSNYALFEIFMQASKELPLPPETFVRGLVQILWSGISPAAAKKKTNE
jgi:AcrR family transcriptional regulator